uniref:Phosphoglycerate kinase n=3 Tax=candidate division WOR-3 bacterium TaxID=2052148 RepID=A0A7V4ABG4_UNCW3
MKSIKNIEIKEGEKIFLRVDYNVPLKEGKVADDTRIKRTLPTIEYLLERKPILILCSHLGRPKGKVVPELSLKPVAERLSEILNKEVHFSEEIVGENVIKKINSLKPGEIILLENIRFHPGETKDDEEFAKELRKLADTYVNDAFGACHRKHTSVHSLAKFFEKKAAGFLLFEETKNLRRVRENPERPAIAILGGAKIDDKIGIIEGLLEVMDKILIGGGMMFTFWKAKGKNTGKSIFTEEYVEKAKELLKNEKIIVAEDALCAENLESEEVKNLEEIPENMAGYDIGEKSIERFKNEIKNAKTIFWNGPMGVFENEKFKKGSFEIAKMIAKITEEGAFSLAGGGETISVIKNAGVREKFSYISTGGGASLEFMEKGTLPGIEALEE